jgi:glycosyltransferase involved in cell wall biosynthesis
MPNRDIFLALFLSKLSAASLLEAIATGLPVVATYIPLLLDYVIDDKASYLVKEYNEESPSRVIIDLIENRDFLNKMQKNCMKYIISHLEMKKIILH